MFVQPKLLIIQTFLLICNSLSNTNKGLQKLFTIERGSISCIFNAAFYISIEKLSISVEQASMSSPVFNMMYLRELDRLKENFTKDINEHQVIVAKNKEDEVIGYVDIDRRNVFDKRFPTPYVSDVIVQPLYRNIGVGACLLSYCSDVVCKKEWKESFLYLWVESENTKALNFYRNQQYVPIQAENGPIDDVSKIKVIEFDTLLEDIELLKYERILLKKSI
mmetsp:Transcript_14484/g.13961  ORF Transcript_14484/g.13961 Transcript_14484/m.13961 type:complete len:221 (-) Transcript_14484:187-849(-)